MTYEEFEKGVFLLTGIDLVFYKEDQMKRRINTFIQRQGLDGYESYLTLIKTDKKSLQKFLDFITINVTDFFRTLSDWQYVADHVLSDLPDDAVIWSTACSTGEEAYSIAISISERRPLGNIRIIATDIDDQALDFARKGEYLLCSLSNVSPSLREKYFTNTEKGFQLSEDIRNHVEFRHLNLLSDEFPKECDLIVCRNVLIYFTDEAKNMLYNRFHDSLKKGGYLFTGQVEQILRYKELDYKKVTKFLYQK